MVSHSPSSSASSSASHLSSSTASLSFSSASLSSSTASLSSSVASVLSSVTDFASSATASASASSNARTGLKQMNEAQIGGFIAAGIAAVCLAATMVGLIYRCLNRRTARREAVIGTTDVSSFTQGNKGTISLDSFDSHKTQPESETAHLLDPWSTAV
ncbi:hypothetical protein MSAN_00938000 [Mycena sanguinolenta]|uniref:Uncharacterized protein n=1 Tax=Mycena sanguinolenta TaxID=230812 RepID=A0A8H6YX18_9AGAR|nr:hypothetical protein MSAN_00938000 [Mycena sanguinolenta]